MPIDRRGYPSARTLDQLIATMQPGPYRDYHERIASATIDGKLMRVEPYLNYTGHPEERRGARVGLENLTLARGLALLGYRDVDATRQLHPDFELRFTDGSQVGVEVTDAAATAAYESRLEELRQAILDRIATESLSLDNRLIMFTFRTVMAPGVAVHLGQTPEVPNEAVPHGRDRAKFVDDIVRWIRAGEHRVDRSITDEFTDPAYPELLRWQTMLSSSQMTNVEDPGAFEPFYPHIGQAESQVVALIGDRIANKCEKAARYGNDRSLWLFVEVADRITRAHRVLENLVSSPPATGPFDLVLVISGGSGVAIERAGVRRVDLVTVNRLEPFSLLSP